MAALPTFSTLARAAPVCSVWYAAARTEQLVWRDVVDEELVRRKKGEAVPPCVASASFIDKVLLVADSFGFDLLACGGLVGCVRHAYLSLGLKLDAEKGAEVHDLKSAADYTVVQRANPRLNDDNPNDDDGDSDDDSSLFLVASVERVSERARYAADVLTVALLLLSSAKDDD